MADLIGSSEVLRPFTPGWQPLFWDLAERSVEELAQATGELLVALAVVRGERAEGTAYQELLGTVLRRLEPLARPSGCAGTSYFGLCCRGRFGGGRGERGRP